MGRFPDRMDRFANRLQPPLCLWGSKGGRDSAGRSFAHRCHSRPVANWLKVRCDELRQANAQVTASQRQQAGVSHRYPRDIIG